MLLSSDKYSDLLVDYFLFRDYEGWQKTLDNFGGDGLNRHTVY